MARLLRNDRTGPVRIEPKDFPPGGKHISICACGLSATFPYCDGTHKTTARLEQPGVLYLYAKDNRTVLEQRPDPEPPPTGTAADPRPRSDEAPGPTSHP